MNVVLLNLFRLGSGMEGSLKLFYPETGIHYILKRIFPHDLFQGKGISARTQQLRIAEFDPVFINVVHSAGLPTTFIVCQSQVTLDLNDGILFWKTGVKIYEYVIEIILFIMSHDKPNLVKRPGIADSECKLWL